MLGSVQPKFWAVVVQETEGVAANRNLLPAPSPGRKPAGAAASTACLWHQKRETGRELQPRLIGWALILSANVPYTAIRAAQPTSQG